MRRHWKFYLQQYPELTMKTFNILLHKGVSESDIRAMYSVSKQELEYFVKNHKQVFARRCAV